MADKIRTWDAVSGWWAAILSETLGAVWSIVSALSTVSTFFFPRLAGKPRYVLVLSTAFGFVWANVQVFRRQQDRIAEQGEELEGFRSRVSRLKIIPRETSRYYASPRQGVTSFDFESIWLEFNLRIENTGQKPSVVETYDVYVKELDRTFPRLRPEEGRNTISTRYAQHSLRKDQILSVMSQIRISAESASDPGTLLFILSGLNLKAFSDAGLRAQHAERRLGPLHCRLTIADTSGSRASADFEMLEM